MQKADKSKIINDPVFGFITIPSKLLEQMIEHPIFQRLTRIKQLGLAFYIYPGAQHTRFHHSIGAMHLMHEALQILRFQGHDVTDEEFEATLACILLHDIGHGPFSHVLEHTFTKGISHETFSLALMERLNKEFDGKLDLCISIFKNQYEKKFLHQLVSGQLDVDRLDYLRRDSYYTGVSEGNIGSARIIKMMDVKDDRLVIKEKGIYSIENFLTSRRLMYWQVYLHKTAIAAEKMLIKAFERVKYLVVQEQDIFAVPALMFFLQNNVDLNFFNHNKDKVLDNFILLDDSDIWSALKVWQTSSDKVLSILSKGIVNRTLFKIKISEKNCNQETIEYYKEKYKSKFKLSDEEVEYFYHTGTVNTEMYKNNEDSIYILQKDSSIKDISEASDILNIQLLSQRVEKFYFTYYPLPNN